MPKFLLKANYTIEGVRGLFKEGGSGRRSAVAQVTESMGGKLEAMYYAFGGDDVFVIVDFPDNISAAAVSLTVAAAGGAKGETVVLLTPEEVDAAVKKTVAYRPPGADT